MSIQVESPPRSRAARHEKPVIVVGYDRSPESSVALAIAVDHAGAEGTVVAVHATPAVPRWTGEPHKARLAAQASHTARQITADIAAVDGGLARSSPASSRGTRSTPCSASPRSGALTRSSSARGDSAASAPSSAA